MKKAILFAALAALILCLPAWGQTIRVTSPNGSSAWSIDSTYSITWTRSGAMPNAVTIRLRVAGSNNSDPAALVIAASADNSGSQGTLSWRIPETVAAGRYFIRVKTVGSPEGTPEVSGDSADFSIRAGAAQTLTVTSPDASSSWRPGSRQTIAWTKTGALNPMANITLRREGAPESAAAADRIADGCANNGSRVWFIPDSLAEGRYFVRVKSGGVQGDSAGFAISPEGRGSELPGPDTPIRADLEMPGVGVEYYNGNIVAWVENNGPDSVRDHNVKFRLNFPERGGGAQIITKRITVPVGAQEGVQLLAMAAGDIPDAGLRTSVSIDTSLSNIQDSQRLNQHREVRLYSAARQPIDLSIQLYGNDVKITRVLLDAGGMFMRRFRIRATMHLRHHSDAPIEITRVKCNWLVQSRNTFETEWRDAWPDQSGSLQLGPFRRGQETTCDFEFDFIVKDYKAVVYRRILFDLDPDRLLNDPDRANNRTFTAQFDAE